MLTGTHIKIANYIYQILKKQYGIRLNKKNLIYGSIKPDFTKNKVPHYIDKSIDYIDNEIECLIENSDNIGVRSFSRRLGMIMHYISDYFCRAHNTAYYRNNLIPHLKYEKRLSKEMTSKKLRKNIIEDFDCNNVKEFIVSLNKEYMKKKSLERDKEYTIIAVNSLCGYIAERINVKLEKSVA